MSVEWVRLRLDVDAFDGSSFMRHLERGRREGILFTTMAELGDGRSSRCALYELNKKCSSDIPDRGSFYTFDEYLADRIETPTYDPRGVVIAVYDGTWVGMAATSLRRVQGYAFSEMTGVVAGYRGRGLSLAMKLLAIDFVRSAEMMLLRTFVHPRNVAAIAMNWRLGFVDDSHGDLT